MESMEMVVEDSEEPEDEDGGVLHLSPDGPSSAGGPADPAAARPAGRHRGGPPAARRADGPGDAGHQRRQWCRRRHQRAPAAVRRPAGAGGLQQRAGAARTAGRYVYGGCRACPVPWVLSCPVPWVLSCPCPVGSGGGKTDAVLSRWRASVERGLCSCLVERPLGVNPRAQNT